MMCEQKTDLQTIIDNLDANPLYHIFLGSRELFHSNFIAWLFEKYPSSRTCLGIEDTDGYSIEREQENIDIVLQPQDKDKPIYIIENKFKSLPSKDQLIRYSKKIKDEGKSRIEEGEKRVEGILLTLFPAAFKTEDINWQQFSYREFAQKLKTWQGKTHNISTSDAPFIGAYITMTQDVSVLIEEICSDRDKGYKYWFDERNKKGGVNYNLLKKIHFHDSILKYHGSALERQINIKIVGLLEEKESNILLNPSKDTRNSLQRDGEIFIHTSNRMMKDLTPCVTIELHRWIEKKQFNLTIQVQNNRYSRLIDYVKFKNLHGGKQRTGLEKDSQRTLFTEKSDNYRWFFSSEKSFPVANWQHLECKHFNRGNRINFCGYFPNGIYQYVKIDTGEDQANLNVSNIEECILSDIKLGLKLLSDNSYIAAFESLPEI